MNELTPASTWLARMVYYLLLMVPLACVAAPPKVNVHVAGDKIVFSNGQIELRFSKDTGRWLSLHNATEGSTLLGAGDRLASVLLTVGGRTTITTGQKQVWSILDTESVGGSTRLVSWRTHTGGDIAWLALETEQGNWQIRQDYGFDLEGDTVHRSVQITWFGEGEKLLRCVDLRTPSVTQLDGTTFAAPGNGFVYEPAERIPLGQWAAMSEEPGSDAPAWRLGLVGIQQRDWSLIVWPFDAEIPSIMLVRRGDWGIWVTQRMLAADRLQPGQALQVGTQFIRVRHGTLLEGLWDFSKFWDQADVRLVGDIPPWARDARIYEVCIGPMQTRLGGTLERYPTVSDLTRDLPRISKLGFNIVQLMPHRLFPEYTVHDYFNIDVQYAPEADLKRMVERAHKLGMKVFLDVVLHGVTDKSLDPHAIFDTHPLLWEHPDWFSRTEDGRVAQTYTWAFDHSNPSLQEYIAKAFVFYAEKLGVDGYRVDAVTWNFFPNWATDLPRPAYSSFYGTAPLMDLVRRQVRRVKPEAVFYTESAGPLYYRSFDLSYNYDEQWLYAALLLPAHTTAPGEWAEPRIDARQLGEWLELRRRALPRGLLRVHHVDSHDSYENSDGVWRRDTFGNRAARLLFALAAFIDGGVMNFAGAEAGSEDFYQQVLTLRESSPALTEGICDYLAIQPSNSHVFAPLRRSGKVWALPVLSFSSEVISTKLPLRALGLAPDVVYNLREAFSGMETTGKGTELVTLKVNLPPYGVQLWMPVPNR